MILLHGTLCCREEKFFSATDMWETLTVKEVLVELGLCHADNVNENKLDQNVASNLGLSETRKPVLHFPAIADLNSKRTVWRAWTKIFYSIAAKPGLGLFNVPQRQITKDNIQPDDLFSLILLAVQIYHT